MLKQLLLVGGCVMLTACVTNIAQLPITSQDREVFKNDYLDEFNSRQVKVKKIAVVLEEEVTKDEIKKQLSKQLCSEIEARLASNNGYESVPRNEIAAVMKNNKFNSMIGASNKAKLIDADYLLVYSITGYHLTKPSDVMTQLLEASVFARGYQGVVKANISLINAKTGKKEVSKAVSGYSQNVAEGAELTIGSPNIAFLAEAVVDAAGKFMSLISADNEKPAVVIQTKGSGKVVMLNIGADSGVMKSSKIEFFEYKRSGDRKIVVPVAYGNVLEVTSRECWVEVDNFETARIRTNHFGRIRNVY